MIGRIEIVTPAQRALLKEIAAGPTAADAVKKLNQDYAAPRPLPQHGAHEQKSRPTAALNDFIRRNSLEACNVDKELQRGS